MSNELIKNIFKIRLYYFINIKKINLLFFNNIILIRFKNKM